ncbi:MAG: molybdate ABC transporter substrate-binding protein [Chlorobiaceae bacterium]|nr:molybdate ABC transporter substrate-binding protein [Chlorobiaceae bacterium]
MQKKPFLFLFAFLLLVSPVLQAENITVAAGGGYKRPLMEIAERFEKKTGYHIDAVFGHMQQIFSQAQMTGQISVLFGERSFFEQSGITFASHYPLGQGKLVLAWRKGLLIKKISDIKGSSVTKVAMPDDKKAVYGKAAGEYLQKSGLGSDISGKLLVVSTVPQVSSYLVTGEVDAGFINVTDAIGVQDNIGGYLPAEQSYYTPIFIQAGVVKGFENQAGVVALMKFLREKEAIAILKHYGL